METVATVILVVLGMVCAAALLSLPFLLFEILKETRTFIKNLGELNLNKHEWNTNVVNALLQEINNVQKAIIGPDGSQDTDPLDDDDDE